jgi:hypothetical protein
LQSTSGFPQAVVSEFYNVATAAALDGSAGNASSLSPGTITTTVSGDLIYQWGIDFSDRNVNGGAFNGTSITPGPAFTLLSADLQVGSADQYYVQPSAGAVTPSLTTSGSAAWGSLVLALKSASAGTPPSPGIRIVHVQHTLLAAAVSQNRPEPVVMQFPCSGNLLIGAYDSGDVSAMSVRDSAQNNWVTAGSALGDGVSGYAQILYAANASTGPALNGITVSLSGTTTSDIMFRLYDVTGAAQSPFDKATTAYGDQNSGGNLTASSLTPSAPNELVLNETQIEFHTINGVIGTGFVLDSAVNAYDDDNPPSGSTQQSTLDEDNGNAHIYAPTTSPVTFVYTHTQPASGVYVWSSVSAAFK